MRANWILREEKKDSLQYRMFEFLAITTVIFLTRLPGLWLAHPNRLLNDSELEMTFGALDRFLGVPSAILIWPAGTLHILAVPCFLADFFIRHATSLSPTSFVAYLSEMYREPWHALLLVRLTVVLVSSLCFASLFAPFANLLGSRAASLMAMLSLATVPMLWSHSYMAVPDSVAFAFGSAALSPVLANPVGKKQVAWAGVLAGLAVASKVTVVPLLLFVVAVAVSAFAGSKWRAILIFASSAFIGFSIGCPYIWTDPVRFVKTVIGNIARQGSPLGVTNALLTTVEVVPFWLLLGFLIGLVLLLKQRRWLTVAGALLTTVMTIKVVADAGVVFPRYWLPLAPVVTVIIAMSMPILSNWVKIRLPENRYDRLLTPTLLGLLVMGNVILYSVRLPAELNEFKVLDEVSADLRALEPQSKIIVPFDNFFYYTVGKSSSESIQRLGDRCAAVMIEKQAVAEFASKSRIPKDAILALPRVFDAQEQDFVAQAAVMSYPGNHSGFDMRIWIKPDLAARFGFLTPQEARAQFTNGEVDALIINEPLDGIEPTKRYANRWLLYVRSKPIP